MTRGPVGGVMHTSKGRKDFLYGVAMLKVWEGECFILHMWWEKGYTYTHHLNQRIKPPIYIYIASCGRVPIYLHMYCEGKIFVKDFLSKFKGTVSPDLQII